MAFDKRRKESIYSQKHFKEHFYSYRQLLLSEQSVSSCKGCLYSVVSVAPHIFLFCGEMAYLAVGKRPTGGWGNALQGFLVICADR